MIRYKDNYYKIPPDRPYCWSMSNEFENNKGSMACKQCSFNEECEHNILKVKTK